MHILQTPHLFSFPKPLNPSPKFQSLHRHFPCFPSLSKPFNSRTCSINCLNSDEFPVDETFERLDLIPKDEETEAEARRLNWIERGWAPWEEILSPEAEFARKSLEEGEEVPLQNPDSIEAFKMLKPSYRLKKMKEMGMTEEEWFQSRFEIKGEIPEPLETQWIGPVVFRHIPPRDWPPRGWEVDKEELEFIREAHKLQAVRIDEEAIKEARNDDNDMCLDRYKMFLKQYKEFVAANKDRLEKESYKYDQDYYPGRRKRGKDYKEGMYELPFYYPGQICAGKVTTLHLYQGAFVDIGGVHDGWVPIKGNDWFWLRHHIKVGMHVIVEILAKRDPYRFRFPIEMRFVDPNIDHLIFKRFQFPPIFHRDEDTNPDELRRDCGRPPVPERIIDTKPEEEPLLSNHPYVDTIWRLHVAEQLILDDLEANPEKYKGKKLSELSDDEDINEETRVIRSKAYFKDSLLPKTTIKTSVKELNLEAAFAERELHNRLKREAIERGEEYKIDKLRRNIEMDEYDFMHWRRSLEEREALMRDISSRQALGLPVEEPGKYKEAKFFGGKDRYDESNPLFRYDYWGEPKRSEISKQNRRTEAHNKEIVGNDDVWYSMPYDEFIEQKLRREARAKEAKKKETEDDTARRQVEDEDEEEEEENEFEFDYSFLSNSSVVTPDQPRINGAEISESG